MPDIIITCVLVIIILLIIGIYKNLKHPFYTAAFSTISGSVGLVAVNLLGIPLAVNIYTVLLSCLMGIPGVVMMLVLKILFIK